MTPPHRLVPRVPAELGELVAELLAKEPAERPAGASEVAERLHRITVAQGAVWDPDLGTGEIDETDEAMEEIEGTFTSRWLPTRGGLDRGGSAARFGRSG